MSVRWYVNRLAAMSGREIVHRGGEQVKRFVSRRRSYGWRSFPQCGPILPVPGLADTLKAGMTPALAAALRAATDRILAGNYSAHGVDWPKRAPDDLFPPELWRLDPVTGRLWPGSEVFCFDVGYRHARQIGDVKFVWDLNRLQFLQPLAAAVAVWNDGPALACIEAAIASWMPANPPFGGLAWNSGIELALRAVSLVVTASLCGDRLGEGTRGLIGQALAAHLFWLARYPSLFSSANNHLVAEALGEFVIAAVLPSLPRAGATEAHARAVLEREAALQILPDGSPAEQSPSYGGFTVEMLLVASTLARAFGRPLAPVVLERATAYADFIGALGCVDGRVPSIGDDDEGRVLTMCGPREYGYPGSVARAVAGHVGRAPRIAPSGDAPELRDAFFPVTADVAACPDGVHSYADGGCTVVREVRAGHRLRLTMDHGPLGYLAIAAHGHADANAITLSLDDVDVLVDPGTYLYHSGDAWRDWFRGTGAHNTVRLGGVDQSLMSGAFNWSHKARAALHAVETAPDWSVSASHDGYVKRFGVEHHRRVAATQAGVMIEDKLVGQGVPVPAEVVFQVAPGLTVEPEGRGWTVRRHAVPLLRLAFSHEGRVTATAGGESPGVGGWVSPNFGDKIEAVRLVWCGPLPPDGLRTTLAWGGD